jgi:putative ABC transport system substrate-binding protein
LVWAAIVLCVAFLAPYVEAQPPPGKVYRIGYLALERSSLRSIPAVIQTELAERGYTFDRNITFEARFAEEDIDRLPILAAELVKLKVDVIYATAPAAIRAATGATSTIPIVMVAEDPVRDGFVASLARPGGNVTGVSLAAYELTVKRLEILKTAIPHLARVGVLGNLAAVPQTVAAVDRSHREGIARSLGLTVQLVDVKTGEELDRGFSAAVRDRLGALIIPNDPVSLTHRFRLMRLALQHQLPTVAEGRIFAEAGGLISYAPDFVEVQRRVAVFIDRLLKGARPSDLPVEQATRFELIINRTTATSLRVKIPQSLLLRADEIID